MRSKLFRTLFQTQLLLQSLLVLFAVLFTSQVFAQPMCSDLFARTNNVIVYNSFSRSGRSVYAERKFKDLLQDLKKDPMIAELMNGFNEVEKGFRIEDHVIHVYSQYLIERRSRIVSRQFADVFPIIIALHDIGKPLAIQNGHRHLQHEYTVPLMKNYLQKHNYSKTQIDMAVALVTYTGFGDLIKGVKSTFEVSVEIHQIAASLGISALDFYNAKRIFYIADAGSYQQLQPLFIKSSAGSLNLKSEKLLELEYWIVSSSPYRN